MKNSIKSLILEIPNLITLSNLACGLIGMAFVMQGIEWMGFVCLLLGAFLDFFDGLAARKLGVAGEMGKQLDSLADVVTFGVLPGLIWKSLMELNGFCPTGVFCINQYIWMMIPLAAAYRLAKFNIDTRQTTGFIGIPTPMTGMALASFAWMSYSLGHSGSIWILQKPVIDLSGLFSNYYVWLYMPLVASYMMISEIPMLSLKRVKNDPLGKYKMILLVMTFPCLLFGSTGVIVYYFGYILVSILSNFAVKSINQ